MKLMFDDAAEAAAGGPAIGRIARIAGEDLWRGGVAAAPLSNTTASASIPGTVNIGQGATIPTDLGQGSLSIGNRVFLDTDGDGVFTKYVDTTIGDVLVTLYRDLDGDGVADGAAIATSTTCGCGLYGFTGLAAGDYIVVIGQANLDGGALAGLYSLAGAGDANDGVDADDNGYAGALGIQSGTIHLTDGMSGAGTWAVDFGFTDVPQLEATMSALSDEGDLPPPGDDDECVPSPEDGIFCGEEPGGLYQAPLGNFYEDVPRVLQPWHFALGAGAPGSTAYIHINASTIGLRILLDGVETTEPFSVAALDDGRVSGLSLPNHNTPGAQLTVTYYDAGMNQIDSRGTSAEISINPVNDAPVGEDRAITIAEDSTYIFSAADFPFTDIENNGFAGIHLTTLPAGGTLWLDTDGNPATPALALAAGQNVGWSDIAAGRLTYVPAADAFGAGHGSFTFQVEDAGPSGGHLDLDVNRDTVARNFTIDVTSTPDLPQATLPTTLAYVEGAAPELIAPDAIVHDPDGNWGGGKLVVTGLLGEDRVAIRSVGDGAGEVRVHNATVYYEGAIAGSVTGGQGRNFVVTFAAGVSEAAVQAITRSLTYANASDTPAASRDLSVNLFDSTGAGLNGFGGFTRLAGSNPFGLETGIQPVFGDVNGDGYVDFVYIGGTETIAPNVMLGDANGNFTRAAGHPLSSAEITSIILGMALADTDNDGDLDLILATESGFGWIGQLDGGQWTDVVWNQYPVAGNALDNYALASVRMAFGDVDGDGDMDLVTTNEIGAISYYRNDGGSFVPASHAFPAQALGEEAQPALLDFDGDGDLDLVIGGWNGLRLYANEGGAYVLKTGADNPFRDDYGNISVGDYDNDGDLDLIVGNGDGLTIWRNDTPAGIKVTVSVAAVNDAPAGADAARTIDEDANYTFLLADFALTDIEGDALAGVKLTTLPANGRLLLDGEPVSEGQIVSAEDIDAGKLVFVPAPDANGTGYGGFTFQVQDNGGTANGGVDLDPAPRAFTLHVTPTPDAPELTSERAFLADGTEDRDYAVSTLDLVTGYTDADGDLLSVTGLSADHGTVSGDAATGWMITPDRDFHGTMTLSYTVTDGNGGETQATATFEVAPANDRPSAAFFGGTLDATEGAPLSLAGAFEIGDPDGADEALTVTLTVGHGTLSADAAGTGAGVSGNGTDTLTLTGTRAQLQSMLAGGGGALLAYASGRGAPPASAAITLTVTDGDGLDARANATIAIAPVDDAPTGANGSVSLDEDGSYTLALVDFGYADAEEDAFSGIIVTATFPGLTLSGAAVEDGQSISAADIAAGRLVYTPPANAFGTAYASIGFRVENANAAASAANTLTFDIANVNDAPSGGIALGGAPIQGDTLTVKSTLADADGMGTLHYQWQRDSGSGFVDVGSDQGTYALGAADVGAKIRVVVSYTDGGGTLESRTAEQVYTITGDARPTTVVHDTFNNRPWSSITTRYDALGGIATETFVLDNGGVWVNSYDTTESSPILWISKRYDASNHFMNRVTAFDDGTYAVTVYDHDHSRAWYSFTVTFDAQWNQTGVTGLRDDFTPGISQSEIDDALDTAMWFPTPYDPNFRTDHHVDIITGGAGADVIYGFEGSDILNGMGGNDFIVGGWGSDTLTGGPGADRFQFSIGDGWDVITDFEAGIDRIDLHGYGVTSFADLLAYMTQDGDKVVIQFDDENRITLDHVQLGDLGADDFWFS